MLPRKWIGNNVQQRHDFFDHRSRAAIGRRKGTNRLIWKSGAQYRLWHVWKKELFPLDGCTKATYQHTTKPAINVSIKTVIIIQFALHYIYSPYNQQQKPQTRSVPTQYLSLLVALAFCSSIIWFMPRKEMCARFNCHLVAGVLVGMGAGWIGKSGSSKI